MIPWESRKGGTTPRGDENNGERDKKAADGGVQKKKDRVKKSPPIGREINRKKLEVWGELGKKKGRQGRREVSKAHKVQGGGRRSACDMIC